MCGGGGGGGTIKMPDYRAYDKQFEMQKSAIDSQINNGALQMQSQLQEALRNQQTVREEIRDAQIAKAREEDKLEEQARRMSVLAGAPPPEPVAQAPKIGSRDRKQNTRKGKGALRIGRKVARSSGQGAGLNIT